jgi:hypothetical protein
MRRLLLAWLGTMLLAMASTAMGAEPSAAQRDQARTLANSGFELFQAGQYADAYARLAEAESIVHAPPHLLYMARAKRSIGQLMAAAELYRRLGAEPLDSKARPQFREAQQQGKDELGALMAQIPAVRIAVHGAPSAQITVRLDDVDVTEAARQGPVSTDPGEHRIQAAAPGRKPAEQPVTLTAGAAVTTVELTLPPGETAPVEPPEPDAEEIDWGGLAPGLVVTGVGVAGLAVGVITGVLALDKAAALDEACPARAACPRENQTLEDDGRTLGTVSTVGFVAGGALVAGGVILLIVQPSFAGGEPEPGADAARLVPLRGPTALGLRGSL